MLFPNPAKGEVPTKIRFGYLNGPRPWILGKIDKSFDKAMGAPVTWTSFPSGPPALAALSAGDIDIARVGCVPVTSALILNAPLKVIALSGVIDGSERLVAKEDVRKLRDLENKGVATVFGSTSHYALMVALDVFGVDASKVRLVEIEPSGQLAAWESGEISASYVWGPYWHDLVAHGGHTLLSSGELNIHGYYLFNVYVVSQDFADKNPELVVRFLETYQAKLDEYEADPEGSAIRIAGELGQDLEGVAQTLKGLVYPNIGAQLQFEWLGSGNDTKDSAIATSFLDQARFLSKLGNVDPYDIPESFSPFIDVSFLRKAAGK
jgi:taurine transport system substrate-binding protein